jgi:hypothetical protein
MVQKGKAEKKSLLIQGIKVSYSPVGKLGTIVASTRG